MYLSETRLLPMQTHETELKIMEHHKEHVYVAQHCIALLITHEHNVELEACTTE